MNRYLSPLLLLMAWAPAASLLGQVHYPDEWWPIGTNAYPGNPASGNAWLRFQDGVPLVQPTDLKMNFEAAMAVASDTTGRVLFYTNGCEVRGADGELLENGEGLNPGPLHDWVCSEVGYTAPRSMTALPLPGYSEKWVILHLGGTYDPSRKMVYGPLYLTEIDMGANQGKGEVTAKNTVIATGDLEPFTLVRHGNGRDWWLILPEYNTHRYQVRLLSPVGLSSPIVQEVGPAIGCRRVGSSVFSPDGSRYARTNSCQAVVLDFGRCTGRFSNPIELSRDPGMMGGGGLAFSPDNRWLYATTDLCMFRADLNAPMPMLDSLYKRPYAFVDEPPVSQYVYGTSLTYMQAAPDGRLYMASRHRERYYPRFSIQGEAFAFEPEGLKLNVTVVRTLPHFPNFRLYDFPNSPCDTLGINGPTSGLNQPVSPMYQPQIRVFPNPVFSQLHVIFSDPSLEGSWQIIDPTGRVLQNGQKVSIEPQTTLSVANWPDGLYVFQFYSREGISIVERFLVMR